MSFFAGIAGGFGQAQGQYNQKMLDFMTQKSQTMSNMYGHLADSVLQQGDPYGISPDLIDRSMQWAQAHPLFNPKGYKDLMRGEKEGIHGIVDRAHQQQINDYHSSLAGAPSQQPSLTAGQSAQPPLQQGQQQPQAQQPSDVNLPFGMTDINAMVQGMSGGHPVRNIFGGLTPTGKMINEIIPDVVKRRAELQDKWNLINQQFGNNPQGGPTTGQPMSGSLDRRSPTGSSQYSEMMRAIGFNVPVTQWRPDEVVLPDENRTPHPVRVLTSWRDGSSWLRQPDGKEVEVFPRAGKAQIKVAPDGSVWSLSDYGANQMPGSMPIQTGASNTTQLLPGGVTSQTNEKRFSVGRGTRAGGPPSPAVAPLVPTGDITVGTVLPPGLNPSANQGPPRSRTSTQKPSEAYKNSGGGFSLEKLEQSFDPVDKQIAAYITHPESFDAPSVRREMWNMEFSRRTNGAVVQAPVPLREFRTDFQKQRQAVVNGFLASRNISNILKDTDAQLVGPIAGRIYELLNAMGTSEGVNIIKSFESGNTDLPPGIAQQAIASLAQERPELAHKLQSQGDLLASKAADLITTMRLFNFADVKNTIGGVQGVSRVYQFLKSSLMNPGMSLPFVLGHLGALNRNMADGLLVLEQARWGSKIPYIREKETLGQLYWDKHVEELISKYQAAAAEKGTTLSRQDAVFLLWRNGKIEADPGNYVDVQKVPSKE